MLLRRPRVQERQYCCLDTTLELIPILSFFSIVYLGAQAQRRLLDTQEKKYHPFQGGHENLLRPQS